MYFDPVPDSVVVHDAPIKVTPPVFICPPLQLKVLLIVTVPEPPIQPLLRVNLLMETAPVMLVPAPLIVTMPSPLMLVPSSVGPPEGMSIAPGGTTTMAPVVVPPSRKVSTPASTTTVPLALLMPPFLKTRLRS